MEGVGHKCSNDKGLTHEGPYHVEEAQFVNGNRSFNFKPNNNLPTHYTLALRNHEKFSYGGGMQQVPRPMQNFNIIMLHLVSKDSNKAVRVQTIKDKGDPSPLRIKC